VQTREQLAIVVTHLGANGRVVGIPRLEADAGVDQRDWVAGILCHP